MTTRRARTRTRRPSRDRPASRPAAAGRAFDRLVALMAELRSPTGCSWDRQQTHRTLRGYLIEETYEAVDAIDRNDLDGLCGELGDVLLQCVFHAELAAERGRFTITDVVAGLTAKLIARHPHVFTASGRRLSARARARQAAASPGAVMEQWNKLKADEQVRSGAPARLLSGVPRALPALLRAHKIGARVSSVGFDWESAAAVVDKVDEELRELRAAVAEGPARLAEEIGDLLFAAANLARKSGLDAEQLLTAANDKFTDRFNRLEAWLADRGLDVHRANRTKLEEAWAEVKAAERRSQTPGTPPARSTSTRGAASRRSRSTPRRPDPS